MQPSHKMKIVLFLQDIIVFITSFLPFFQPFFISFEKFRGIHDLESKIKAVHWHSKFHFSYFIEL